jgi:copper transport protein
VARFSGVATIAILAVGATGVALAWTQVRTVSSLTSTTYGQLLLVKVAIVAMIAGLAAYNRFVLVPAVAAAATDDRRRDAGWRVLGRTVRLEAVAIGVAVAVTAALVNVTPARAEVTGPASATAPLGEGSVKIVVDPPQAGRGEVQVHLLDGAGRPADLAHHGLSLELSLPARSLGPIVREPDPLGPGRYELDGADLSVAGRWRIDVVARVSRFEQLRATTELTIAP